MCPVATIISPKFPEQRSRTVRGRVCIFDGRSDPAPDAFDPLPMCADKTISAINAGIQDSYPDPSLTPFMVFVKGPDVFILKSSQKVKERPRAL